MQPHSQAMNTPGRHGNLLLLLSSTLVVLLLLLGAACTGATPPSPADARRATEVQVTATEFKLEPNLITIAVGRPVRLTLVNKGAIEHDWEAEGLRATDVRVVSAPPNLAKGIADEVREKGERGIPHPWAGPGQQMVIEFTPLVPGSYDVACVVPGHKEAGMVAKLVVTGEAAGQPAAEGRSEAPTRVERGPSAAPPAAGAPSAPAPAHLAQPQVAMPVGSRAAGLVSVGIEAKEATALLDESVSYRYWTFGGAVPGPMVRVRQGDTVELTLKNAPDSTMTHSIDLHAVTGPGGGARVTQVAPGEQAIFRFQALNPGVYVYHCATPVAPVHVANGMYGLIVVEPPQGLPPVDREFYVMQGDFYLQGARGEKGERAFSMEKLLDERPDYVVFNGSNGALVGDGALRARVGETVRIFFGVGGPNLVSSFHVIGEIFDRVAREGASEWSTNIQTTLVPAGGATIVEFTLDVPGEYLLVDHSLGRVVKGAVGILRVGGDDRPEIFQPLSGAPAPDMGH